MFLAGNVGACVTNTKPNSPSYSLGLVEQPPKVTKDGTLLLEYRGIHLNLLPLFFKYVISELIFIFCNRRFTL
jgi:hypothetical protein